MEKQDKTIICKDCGKEFVFTVGQQEHFAQLGFTNEPVRCKDCRNKKNAERNANRKFDNRNNDNNNRW